MKHIIYICTLTLLTMTNSFGQKVADSVYSDLSANKNKSIFKNVKKGTFTGITNGYVQLKHGKDTLVLDYQMSKTVLNVIYDPNEMYDISTKRYSTQTTSGKTTLTYEIYATANILIIRLNGLTYSIGIIDGACDLLIPGLTFHYCSDNTTEFLTLFVTQPLELTTTRALMEEKNMDYNQAQKKADTITLLAGSTLILVFHK